MWWGKLLGSFFGYLCLGPFGLLLGCFLGHKFDQARFVSGNLHFFNTSTQHVPIQSAFFKATFSIMGYVAKADGRVSENEIQAARRLMSQMGLNEEQRQDAMRLFTEGKNSDFNLTHALLELQQVCHRQLILMQMFIEIQMQAALADGALSQNKIHVLQIICQTLGVGIHFDRFADSFDAENAYRHSQRRAQTSPFRSNLEDAYALLAIPKTATDAEVKRAYRRLMSQNHPDKLVANGLPESMMKVATEKTQKIKAAYEQVCAARGT